MEKCYKNIFRRPYRSNCTKINLDAALVLVHVWFKFPNLLRQLCTGRQVVRTAFIINIKNTIMDFGNKVTAV